MVVVGAVVVVVAPGAGGAVGAGGGAAVGAAATLDSALPKSRTERITGLVKGSVMDVWGR